MPVKDTTTVEEFYEGIDISSHQGDVDHFQVADSGMLFCMVKATEGRGYGDPLFAQNIDRIREVLDSGKIYYPGAYHFARPDSIGGAEDGRAEAEDFCDIIEEVCGSILQNFMPPSLDFEMYSESDFNENIPWITAWIETVERRLERQPMIYTGANVWRYEVGNTAAFVSYPLWQTYYSGEADAPPAMPWPTWAMWQYSAGGNFQHHPPVPGVGVVDVNRWHGALEELEVFARGASSPPPAVGWPSPPPTVDLNVFRGAYSDYVARVQGLLLSYGYGPDGLTSAAGHPDGRMGDKTQAYLSDFKLKHLLPGDAVMDWSTWWAINYDRLALR